MISPLAKGNAYNSTLNYTHSSDLKTLQELFGVPAPGGGFLGDANTAGHQRPLRPVRGRRDPRAPSPSRRRS